MSQTRSSSFSVMWSTFYATPCHKYQYLKIRKVWKLTLNFHMYKKLCQVVNVNSVSWFLDPPIFWQLQMKWAAKNIRLFFTRILNDIAYKHGLYQPISLSHIQGSNHFKTTENKVSLYGLTFMFRRQQKQKKWTQRNRNCDWWSERRLRWFGFTLLTPPKVCKTSTRVFNQKPRQNNRNYFLLLSRHVSLKSISSLNIFDTRLILASKY